MLLMPSDCCVFSSYRSAEFCKKIYIIPYEIGLLKNRNYMKTISMKINNEIKYSFNIKQLIKSDVKVYCRLLCNWSQYGMRTGASLLID